MLVYLRCSLQWKSSDHLAALCTDLREVLLLEVMNVCHCVKQPNFVGICVFLCVFCCCCCCCSEGSDFWYPLATQQPPPPNSSSGKTDYLFFHHLCWGRGPWHLLDEPSLVLSLSANVWVYWCAVTGPGWSYPTRIRASCCASSVCVCPDSRIQTVNTGCSKHNAPSTFTPRPRCSQCHHFPAPD